MPLYEYECKKCGERVEIAQKFGDEPLTRCPDNTCDGEISKVIGRVSFDLKGAGWARDGYK